MCLKRRLARQCDMVTQQRDHATPGWGLCYGRRAAVSNVPSLKTKPPFAFFALFAVRDTSSQGAGCAGIFWHGWLAKGAVPFSRFCEKGTAPVSKRPETGAAPFSFGTQGPPEIVLPSRAGTPRIGTWRLRDNATRGETLAALALPGRHPGGDGRVCPVADGQGQGARRATAPGGWLAAASACVGAWPVTATWSRNSVTMPPGAGRAPGWRTAFSFHHILAPRPLGA